MRQSLEACELVLVVTTPEPTAIADAYATIKALSGNGVPTLEILINQAASPAQATAISDRIRETARNFLRVEVGFAGSIPQDPEVPIAVTRRQPFVIGNPGCPASQALSQLAQRVLQFFQAQPLRGALFPRMHAGQLLEAA